MSALSKETLAKTKAAADFIATGAKFLTDQVPYPGVWQGIANAPGLLLDHAERAQAAEAARDELEERHAFLLAGIEAISTKADREEIERLRGEVAELEIRWESFLERHGRCHTGDHALRDCPGDHGK